MDKLRTLVIAITLALVFTFVSTASLANAEVEDPSKIVSDQYVESIHNFDSMEQFLSLVFLPVDWNSANPFKLLNSIIYDLNEKLFNAANISMNFDGLSHNTQEAYSKIAMNLDRIENSKAIPDFLKNQMLKRAIAPLAKNPIIYNELSTYIYNRLLSDILSMNKETKHSFVKHQDLSNINLIKLNLALRNTTNQRIIRDFISQNLRTILIRGISETQINKFLQRSPHVFNNYNPKNTPLESRESEIYRQYKLIPLTNYEQLFDISQAANQFADLLKGDNKSLFNFERTKSVDFILLAHELANHLQLTLIK